MKALAPNTLIQNRYLIVQLIGKGGMGEVYLAVDQRLGSAIALKRTYFADDEMLGNAFEREARILARLRHPVLPKVSDHFAENGEQYLIMEHISGDDLSKRLDAAQKPFPSSWVLFWADQLLDALSYLHSHEPPIIHRDIKPQNLKLTDENHIVLLDFGLSKNSTGQTNVTSGSKHSGSVVGYTPHYAPMEQIRGTGTGPRSDLYSLSATLYQLMTNTVPVDALTRADAMLNAMPDPIRKISDLSPEISPAVSDVILQGMEVSQEKRFANARDMQKALRKAYTAMQEAMGAQTMVYSGAEAAKEGISGNIDTSAGAPAGGQSAPATLTPDLQTYGSGGTTGGYEQPQSATPQNFGETIKYDGPTDSPVRQADVKTEVYRADESPLISGGFESPTPATPFNSHPTPPVEDFRPTENYGAGTPGFSPDATVPIMSMGEAAAPSAGGAATPEFFTTPNIPVRSDSFSTVSQGTAEGQVSTPSGYVTKEPVKKATVPSVKKKSSSKKLVVALGILGLLFVMGLAGAGGGYYVYSNYYAVTPTPTPSPEPSIEGTPSPEATQESIVNTIPSPSPSATEDLTVSPTPVSTATPFIEITPGQTRPTPQKENTPQVRPTRTPVIKTQPTPKARPTPLQ
jgi:serine/threonine protein kinase